MLAWADNIFDSDDPGDVRDLERSPLGRVTRTEEIAGTVAFLVSEEAGAITGSTVTVDAGYLCR